MESDEDTPKAISFTDLNKKKRGIPDSLLDYHYRGIDIIKKSKAKKNDPRFDSRVKGYCNLSDWDHLKNSNDKLVKKLKMYMDEENADAELKEDMKKALKYLKQRKATMKDLQLRKSVKDKIRGEQVSKLKAGEIPKFMKRKEVKKKIVEERLQTMSSKQKEKYLSKKSKKKGVTATFDES